MSSHRPKPRNPRHAIEIGINQRKFAVLNVLDLFRYSAESLPHIDVTPGGEPYFSIDGGVTHLADFGSGLYNGDGEQAGHWRDVVGEAESLPWSGRAVCCTDVRAASRLGTESR